MEFNLIRKKITEEKSVFENVYSTDNSEETQGEIIQEIFDDYLEKKVTDFLSSKSLDFMSVDVDEDGCFSILYESRDFGGRLPNRISQIIEDLSNFLTEQLGVNLSWGFGKNGNCSVVNFFPEKEITREQADVQRALWLS